MFSWSQFIIYYGKWAICWNISDENNLKSVPSGPQFMCIDDVRLVRQIKKGIVYLGLFLSSLIPWSYFMLSKAYPYKWKYQILKSIKVVISIAILIISIVTKSWRGQKWHTGGCLSEPMLCCRRRPRAGLARRSTPSSISSPNKYILNRFLRFFLFRYFLKSGLTGASFNTVVNKLPWQFFFKSNFLIF